MTEEYYISFPKKQCPTCCCIAQPMTLYIPPEIISKILLSIGPTGFSISKKFSNNIGSELFNSIIKTQDPFTDSYLLLSNYRDDAYSDVYMGNQNVFNFRYASDPIDEDVYALNEKSYKDYTKKSSNQIRIENPVYVIPKLLIRAKFFEDLFGIKFSIKTIKNIVLDRFIKNCNSGKYSHSMVKSFSYIMMVVLSTNSKFNNDIIKTNCYAWNLVSQEINSLKKTLDNDFRNCLKTLDDNLEISQIIYNSINSS